MASEVDTPESIKIQTNDEKIGGTKEDEKGNNHLKVLKGNNENTDGEIFLCPSRVDEVECEDMGRVSEDRPEAGLSNQEEITITIPKSNNQRQHENDNVETEDKIMEKSSIDVKGQESVILANQEVEISPIGSDKQSNRKDEEEVGISPLEITKLVDENKYLEEVGKDIQVEEVSKSLFEENCQDSTTGSSGMLENKIRAEDSNIGINLVNQEDKDLDEAYNNNNATQIFQSKTDSQMTGEHVLHEDCPREIAAENLEKNSDKLVINYYSELGRAKEYIETEKMAQEETERKNKDEHLESISEGIDAGEANSENQGARNDTVEAGKSGIPQDVRMHSKNTNEVSVEEMTEFEERNISENENRSSLGYKAVDCSAEKEDENRDVSSNFEPNEQDKQENEVLPEEKIHSEQALEASKSTESTISEGNSDKEATIKGLNSTTSKTEEEKNAVLLESETEKRQEINNAEELVETNPERLASLGDLQESKIPSHDKEEAMREYVPEAVGIPRQSGSSLEVKEPNISGEDEKHYKEDDTKSIDIPIEKEGHTHEMMNATQDFITKEMIESVQDDKTEDRNLQQGITANLDEDSTYTAIFSKSTVEEKAENVNDEIEEEKFSEEIEELETATPLESTAFKTRNENQSPGKIIDSSIEKSEKEFPIEENPVGLTSTESSEKIDDIHVALNAENNSLTQSTENDELIEQAPLINNPEDNPAHASNVGNEMGNEIASPRNSETNNDTHKEETNRNSTDFSESKTVDCTEEPIDLTCQGEQHYASSEEIYEAKAIKDSQKHASKEDNACGNPLTEPAKEETTNTSCQVDIEVEDMVGDNKEFGISHTKADEKEEITEKKSGQVESPSQSYLTEENAMQETIGIEEPIPSDDDNMTCTVPKEENSEKGNELENEEDGEYMISREPFSSDHTTCTTQTSTTSLESEYSVDTKDECATEESVGTEIAEEDSNMTSEIGNKTEDIVMETPLDDIPKEINDEISMIPKKQLDILTPEKSEIIDDVSQIANVGTGENSVTEENGENRGATEEHTEGNFSESNNVELQKDNKKEGLLYGSQKTDGLDIVKDNDIVHEGFEKGNCDHGDQNQETSTDLEASGSTLDTEDIIPRRIDSDTISNDGVQLAEGEQVAFEGENYNQEKEYPKDIMDVASTEENPESAGVVEKHEQCSKLAAACENSIIYGEANNSGTKENSGVVDQGAKPVEHLILEGHNEGRSLIVTRVEIESEGNGSVNKAEDEDQVVNPVTYMDPNVDHPPKENEINTCMSDNVQVQEDEEVHKLRHLDGLDSVEDNKIVNQGFEEDNSSNGIPSQETCTVVEESRQKMGTQMGTPRQDESAEMSNEITQVIEVNKEEGVEGEHRIHEHEGPENIINISTKERFPIAQATKELELNEETQSSRNEPAEEDLQQVIVVKRENDEEKYEDPNADFPQQHNERNATQSDNIEVQTDGKENEQSGSHEIHDECTQVPNEGIQVNEVREEAKIDKQHDSPEDEGPNNINDGISAEEKLEQADPNEKLGCWSQSIELGEANKVEKESNTRGIEDCDADFAESLIEDGHRETQFLSIEDEDQSKEELKIEESRSVERESKEENCQRAITGERTDDEVKSMDPRQLENERNTSMPDDVEVHVGEKTHELHEPSEVNQRFEEDNSTDIIPHQQTFIGPEAFTQNGGDDMSISRESKSVEMSNDRTQHVEVNKAPEIEAKYPTQEHDGLENLSNSSTEEMKYVDTSFSENERETVITSILETTSKECPPLEGSQMSKDVVGPRHDIPKESIEEEKKHGEDCCEEKLNIKSMKEETSSQGFPPKVEDLENPALEEVKIIRLDETKQEESFPNVTVSSVNCQDVNAITEEDISQDQISQTSEPQEQPWQSSYEHVEEKHEILNTIKDIEESAMQVQVLKEDNPDNSSSEKTTHGTYLTEKPTEDIQQVIVVKREDDEEKDADIPQQCSERNATKSDNNEVEKDGKENEESGSNETHDKCTQVPSEGIQVNEVREEDTIDKQHNRPEDDSPDSIDDGISAEENIEQDSPVEKLEYCSQPIKHIEANKPENESTTRHIEDCVANYAENLMEKAEDENQSKTEFQIEDSQISEREYTEEDCQQAIREERIDYELVKQVKSMDADLDPPEQENERNTCMSDVMEVQEGEKTQELRESLEMNPADSVEDNEIVSERFEEDNSSNTIPNQQDLIRPEAFTQNRGDEMSISSESKSVEMSNDTTQHVEVNKAPEIEAEYPTQEHEGLENLNNISPQEVKYVHTSISENDRGTVIAEVKNDLYKEPGVSIVANTSEECPPLEEIHTSDDILGPTYNISKESIEEEEKHGEDCCEEKLNIESMKEETSSQKSLSNIEDLENPAGEKVEIIRFPSTGISANQSVAELELDDTKQEGNLSNATVSSISCQEVNAITEEDQILQTDDPQKQLSSENPEQKHEALSAITNIEESATQVRVLKENSEQACQVATDNEEQTNSFEQVVKLYGQESSGIVVQNDGKAQEQSGINEIDGAHTMKDEDIVNQRFEESNSGNENQDIFAGNPASSQDEISNIAYHGVQLTEEKETTEIDKLYDESGNGNTSKINDSISVKEIILPAGHVEKLGSPSEVVISSEESVELGEANRVKKEENSTENLTVNSYGEDEKQGEDYCEENLNIKSTTMLKEEKISHEIPPKVEDLENPAVEKVEMIRFPELKQESGYVTSTKINANQSAEELEVDETKQEEDISSATISSKNFQNVSEITEEDIVQDRISQTNEQKQVQVLNLKEEKRDDSSSEKTAQTTDKEEQTNSSEQVDRIYGQESIEFEENNTEKLYGQESGDVVVQNDGKAQEQSGIHEIDGAHTTKDEDIVNQRFEDENTNISNDGIQVTEVKETAEVDKLHDDSENKTTSNIDDSVSTKEINLPADHVEKLESSSELVISSEESIELGEKNRAKNDESSEEVEGHDAKSAENLIVNGFEEENILSMEENNIKLDECSLDKSKARNEATKELKINDESKSYEREDTGEDFQQATIGERIDEVDAPELQTERNECKPDNTQEDEKPYELPGSNEIDGSDSVQVVEVNKMATIEAENPNHIIQVSAEENPESAYPVEKLKSPSNTVAACDNAITPSEASITRNEEFQQTIEGEKTDFEIKNLDKPNPEDEELNASNAAKTSEEGPTTLDEHQKPKDIVAQEFNVPIENIKDEKQEVACYNNMLNIENTTPENEETSAREAHQANNGRYLPLKVEELEKPSAKEAEEIISPPELEIECREVALGGINTNRSNDEQIQEKHEANIIVTNMDDNALNIQVPKEENKDDTSIEKTIQDSWLPEERQRELELPTFDTNRESKSNVDNSLQETPTENEVQDSKKSGETNNISRQIETSCTPSSNKHEQTESFERVSELHGEKLTKSEENGQEKQHKTISSEFIAEETTVLEVEEDEATIYNAVGEKIAETKDVQDSNQSSLSEETKARSNHEDKQAHGRSLGDIENQTMMARKNEFLDVKKTESFDETEKAVIVNEQETSTKLSVSSVSGQVITDYIVRIEEGEDKGSSENRQMDNTRELDDTDIQSIPVVKEGELGQNYEKLNLSSQIQDSCTDVSVEGNIDIKPRSTTQTNQTSGDMQEEGEQIVLKEKSLEREQDTEEQKTEEEKEDEGNDQNQEDVDLKVPLITEASRDIDLKATHKKPHNILSGVGSKVKHSISKVKKAISCTSSQFSEEEIILKLNNKNKRS